ncbi:hypothetical protein DTO96_100145 [Ephemeroptericola cinctiostellae]|uniref:Uncharacterized protein n=1 Tax=Ephemeroptericola cinctiostellae TaxID=2268024 RepID=A0A345D7V0_9BURK|nr:hypothetical protein DTO96_100145 [Ephemeroptericola cinctiostellae]
MPVAQVASASFKAIDKEAKLRLTNWLVGEGESVENMQSCFRIVAKYLHERGNG